MAGNGLFQSQNGYASYIINCDIPIEEWVHMYTDDPETIRLVKLLARDLQTIISVKGRSAPGAESGGDFKDRVVIDLNSEGFFKEKVSHGVAANRLTQDIRRKFRDELIHLQYQLANEALVRCETVLKEDIERVCGGECERCFLTRREEVATPFFRLVDEEVLRERVDEWPCLAFGFREFNGRYEGYFILIGGINYAVLEYERIHEEYGRTNRVINTVCEEMLALDFWWPSPQRGNHPDTRMGWTICNKAWDSGEIIETFTGFPGSHGLKLFSEL